MIFPDVLGIIEDGEQGEKNPCSYWTLWNLQNQVFGVISGKDFMPFLLKEWLRLQLAPQSPDASEQRLDSRPCMHS